MDANCKLLKAYWMLFPKNSQKNIRLRRGYGILYLRLHLPFGGRIGGYIRDPRSKIALPGQARTTVFYPDWRLAGPICHCTAYVVMDGTKPIGAQPPRLHVAKTRKTPAYLPTPEKHKKKCKKTPTTTTPPRAVGHV